MTQEIIEVNPSSFGIEEGKANELMGNLPQIIGERAELAKQYDEVIRMDVDNPETSTIAKKLRLLIRDNRTKGIAVWHKTSKDFFLKGGQFVDAIKRKEEAVNERMEETLEKIEKHAEIKRQEEIKALRETRLKILEPYGVENAEHLNIGELREEVWQKFFDGVVASHNAKMEAERKAEEDRIAKEKAEAEERERVRLENERLKKMSTLGLNWDGEQFVFRDINFHWSDLVCLSDSEFDAAFEGAKKRKEQIDFEETQEKESLKAKLAAERAERERLQKLEHDRMLAEVKANADAVEAAKRAAAAPDRDKLLAFVQSIRGLTVPEVTTPEAAQITGGIRTMIGKMAAYIEEKAQAL
jgi:colicin import membrane protein